MSKDTVLQIPQDLDLNDQFKKAIDILENTQKFVLITGRAGTGKSTLLNYFREKTSKKIAVLSPTGAAAVNISGQTIHSFFGFRPGVTVDDARKEAVMASEEDRKLFKELDAVVIDEISMVRADLFDCIDVFLRTLLNNDEIFGGKQIICFGDLYQLSPVLTSQERSSFEQLYDSPYFFDSKVFTQLLTFADYESRFEYIQLEKIYRQKDSGFIQILNAIRNRSIQSNLLNKLNNRVLKKSELNKFITNKYFDGVFLTSLNKQANEINSKNLDSLDNKGRVYEALIEGDFSQSSFPTDLQLELKKDARVMMLYNDPRGRWINGSLGFIKDLSKESVKVELDSGGVYEVEYHTWNIYHTKFNKKSKQLEQENIGAFTQLPLRLAWAITIHKSQGKTFEKVVVDLGRSAFAVGQTYVALSRCTSLEGLHLARKVRMSDVRVNFRVSKFLTNLQYDLVEISLEDKIEMLERAAIDGKKVRIVYLKSKDEKSERVVEPMQVGDMNWRGYDFVGLRAFCYKANAERNFNVEKILEIEVRD